MGGYKGTLVLSAEGLSFIPDNLGKGTTIPFSRMLAISIEGRLLKKLCIVDDSGRRTLISAPQLDEWKQTIEMALRIYEALSSNQTSQGDLKNSAHQNQHQNSAVQPPVSKRNITGQVGVVAAGAPPTTSANPAPNPTHNPPAVYNGQWPSGQDYEQSFQTLKLSLNPSLGAIDRWEAIRNSKNPSWFVQASGNYGSIYKVRSDDGKFYALKCFTKKSLTINKRYSRISDYLNGMKNIPEFLIHFSYFPEGIRTRKVPGVYFPMLKMEWIDGVTLNQFISANLEDGKALKATGNRIVKAVADLQKAGIAHGDLSGDNIIIDSSGNIKFVDYDGMYIPAFKGEKATELGHADFQHPGRTADTYSEKLDSFSALVIQISMQVLSLKPDLWKRFNNNDPDCLILRKTDFLKPEDSEALQVMGKIRSKNIRKLLEFLNKSLKMDPLWSGLDPMEMVI